MKQIRKHTIHVSGRRFSISATCQGPIVVDFEEFDFSHERMVLTEISVNLLFVSVRDITFNHWFNTDDMHA